MVGRSSSSRSRSRRSSTLARVPAAAPTPSQEELGAQRTSSPARTEYARGRWREALREFEARLRAVAAAGVPDQLRAGAPQARRVRRGDARVSALPGDGAAAGAGGAGAAAARADRGRARARAGAAARRRRAPTAAKRRPADARRCSCAAPPPAPPKKKRRAWIAPVVVAGVLVVAGAVIVGLVFGLPARDTFKPTPLGTVDFR